MKANKVTVTITTETLSIDCVPSLLVTVAEQIGKEVVTGKLRMDDGDSVKWSASIKKVKF